jgi:hypothetical protein
LKLKEFTMMIEDWRFFGNVSTCSAGHKAQNHPMFVILKKGNVSLYMPRYAPRVSGGSGSQDFQKIGT